MLCPWALLEYGGYLAVTLEALGVPTNYFNIFIEALMCIDY